ncbi:MAG: DUF2259 domain-containing protein [Hyphomicrobiaceae bacterium]|nr:DUF2259 domain-containing protein [Hyphomicrobiaceae bacterium]MCC0024261.1 DUF2259 domain-containing protein [Hyphomicrobiaceae bacterium]
MTRFSGLFIATAVILFSTISQASAQGLLTNFDVIGYSRDGRYFAFETFGRDPGTGTAYASLYVQDVSTNRFVLGTPTNAKTIDPNEPLGSVMEKARAQTPTLLNDLEIDLPAIIEAMNGDGMADANTQKLDFGLLLNDGSGRIVGDYRLELDSFDTSATTDCRGLSGSPTPKGFTLTLSSGDQDVVLHKDEVLTRSRGCPLSYEIKALFVPAGAVDISHGVALIAAQVQTDAGIVRQFLPVATGAR